MSFPLVSIIVPFYNPDACFSQLLESIESQTYSNIEVVLVDDGSREEFKRLAVNFSRRHRNALLITQRNSGVASARQAGVDAANGELIIHADSDDLLPENAIESLVRRQMEAGADIVVGSYLERTKRSDLIVNAPLDESYKGFVQGVLTGKYHAGLWNKLIKKDLYNSIHFEPGINFMEDKLLLAKMFRRGAYKIAFTPVLTYIYQRHKNSATSRFSLESINSVKKVTNIICDMYRGEVPDALICEVKRESRVLELLQLTKHGVNDFKPGDRALTKCKGLSFNKRLALFFLSVHMGFLVKFYYQLGNLSRYD
ncbi:glycosyltransferase family 2 protein [Parahaliea sp. F7430]|uniref:Glycosyltransferase family 2 protein n=1 Tax=Sediminihaliea albiluteola TaxID=2758564 RepID=A0A7W2TUU3_9GAMM|nr:glycosyltransferase family 2 protein [Sediminihaliea albiluteola]MBA6412300.1 glycosyltransferase family 2 protein [Sediminihaliea albiluteola]